MGTKNNPGAFDCYANAEPDEPMFVLLGRDRHAAALVNLWAAMRKLEANPEDAEKIAEAEQCAESMLAWFMGAKPEATPAGMVALSRALALLAETVGAVVHIDQESLQPLAMGNYRHRVSVRARR